MQFLHSHYAFCVGVFTHPQGSERAPILGGTHVVGGDDANMSVCCGSEEP